MERWWAAAQRDAPWHWLVGRLARRLSAATGAGAILYPKEMPHVQRACAYALTLLFVADMLKTRLLVRHAYYRMR